LTKNGAALAIPRSGAVSARFVARAANMARDQEVWTGIACTTLAISASVGAFSARSLFESRNLEKRALLARANTKSLSDKSLPGESDANEWRTISGQVVCPKPLHTLHGRDAAVILDDSELLSFARAGPRFVKLYSAPHWSVQQPAGMQVHVDVASLGRVLGTQPRPDSLFGLEESPVDTLKATRWPLHAGVSLLRKNWFLPVLGSVTLLGRLVFEDGRQPVVRAHPSFGLLLLGGSLDEYLAYLRQRQWGATRWLCASLAVAASQVLTLSCPGWLPRSWELLCDAAELTRRAWHRLVGGGTSATLPPVAGGGDEEGEAAGGRDCLACMDRPVATALMPCGHACLCRPCAARVSSSRLSSERRCPLCRSPITRTVRIYISGTHAEPLTPERGSSASGDATPLSPTSPGPLSRVPATAPRARPAGVASPETQGAEPAAGGRDGDSSSESTDSDA
jgi:hypothetical protein